MKLFDLFENNFNETNQVQAGANVLRQLQNAINSSSDIDLKIGVEMMPLKYHEARYLRGLYKSFAQQGRQEDGLRMLGDAGRITSVLDKLDAKLAKFKTGLGEADSKKKLEELDEVRNPDLMSPEDYDRYQQQQMDASKRRFKRQELQHELGHEKNNIQVVINGKPWKVFPGRGYADSQEEFKFLQSMRAWAQKKSAATGKKWEVYLTGASPTIEEQGMAKGLNEFTEKPEQGPGSDDYEELLFNLAYHYWEGDSAGFGAERKLSLLGWKPEYGDDYIAIELYKIGTDGSDENFRSYTIDEFEDFEQQMNSGQKGVAEAAFKDPSPMMKDSIKQDRIRSLKNLIAVAKVKGVHHKVKEYELELKKLKETTEVTEAGPFSYGAKPPRKGSVAYNAMMQRKEQDKKRVKEIEAIGTKNHHIGIAKVTKEEVEVNESDMYTYIDQTKGPVLRGKTGTFVGYTHSTSKGKGANILKHNKTGKYYAAGGSSTAFTQKTTLHDTPQAAAKAYHKGNLAEVLNVGKSFKDLREAAFHSNCCPDEEYGFTEEEFTVTGTEQYEDWGDDMVEGKLSFTRLTQKLHEEDGKNVKLNKPFLTPGGPKKRAVYVKNDKGNTVKVNFGDPNLEIKRDDPERRSSFRARHNCDNPGPKWKARYWSCKFWSSTPVSKL